MDDAGPGKMMEVDMSMAFNSSDTEHMSRALLQALFQLEAAGLSNGDTQAIAKAVLARAIVEAAGRGERDEQKLVIYAIEHYPQMRERLRGGSTWNDSAANSVK